MKLNTSASIRQLISEEMIDNPTPGILTDHFHISQEDIIKILGIGLSKGGDFSEIFFEYQIVNAIHMEEDIIKESSARIGMGVGIRVLKDDQTGYGYSNEITCDKMKIAALTAAAIANGKKEYMPPDFPGAKSNRQVYDMESCLSFMELATKISLIKRAYSAAQTYDPLITKVQAQLFDSLQVVTIVNSEGLVVSDVRPQIRLLTTAVAEKGKNKNSGFFSAGGRTGFNYFTYGFTPEEIGKHAAEEAVTLISAIDPNAGEQPVVLGAGQSGVMIHEAIGHPLEADGNRRKTSIMWNKIGKQIANPIVTIYDDPTIPHLRGSLNVDDEGTIPEKTLLVENGRLIGFLQDRLSAKLMHMKPTGHGRRSSYQDHPVPRMANTVLARGKSDPEAIIRSVKKGFYAKSYQGGQVQDSGKFTFTVNLGYVIENGKLTHPVKNATLIGTNIQILKDVEMIGNDMGFFLGTCGKEGQSVPVTAGTPTLKISKMTVGGR